MIPGNVHMINLHVFILMNNYFKFIDAKRLSFMYPDYMNTDLIRSEVYLHLPHIRHKLLHSRLGTIKMVDMACCIDKMTHYPHYYGTTNKKCER